jgi:hypothetical protein
LQHHSLYNLPEQAFAGHNRLIQMRQAALTPLKACSTKTKAQSSMSKTPPHSAADRKQATSVHQTAGIEDNPVH